jgi:hypothetical protein
MAREIIKENHPLNDTPLAKVFPLFKVCSKSPSKKEEKKHLLDEEMFREGTTRDRKASVQKKKKTAAEIPQDTDEDPFNFLGFGMVAYRDLMLVMILLFTVISILMIPAMYMYSSHTTYSKGYSKLSLGNLGYSSTQC